MICPYVNFDPLVRVRLSYAELVDVDTGGPVKEPTRVRTCWDDQAIYFRFEYRDDYAVSPYVNHDDPLYEHDVVEFFIDKAGEVPAIPYAWSPSSRIPAKARWKYS
ncbi:sugar-binding protein [Paenibacillus eucommiae]|nr:sugar-binding protein [Paenibacillus eucommiae]